MTRKSVPVLLADVVERADVRMVELRDRAGFAVEPLAELRISGEGFGQDLDGDDAIEARVAGLVDLAHAAGAEGGEDLVRAEARARRDHLQPYVLKTPIQSWRGSGRVMASAPQPNSAQPRSAPGSYPSGRR